MQIGSFLKPLLRGATRLSVFAILVPAFSLAGQVIGILPDATGPASDGSYVFSGWACEQGSTASILVDLYLGGTAQAGGVYAGTFPANQYSEPAVASACASTGTAYRFSARVTAAQVASYGGQYAYAYGISPLTGSVGALWSQGIGAKLPLGSVTPVSSASSFAGGSIPLIEYINQFNGIRDVIYGSVGAFAGSGFLPSQALGFAFPPGTRGPNLLPIYRCAGPVSAIHAGWNFSFYGTDPGCQGNRFDSGQVSSVSEAAVIYAQMPQDVASIPLFRYWVGWGTPQAVPVLSTVTPGSSNLAVMRYSLDPTTGPIPVGYLGRMDAVLDGNQRWLNGLPQNLCYGISRYQQACPGISGSSALWQLIDLRSGATVYSQSTSSLGMASVPAAAISNLLQSGTIHSNAPLLLTVQSGNTLLGAKNVRIIRTPFVAEYDNRVLSDDDGDPSGFPTQSSAYLLANMMTAHPLFTDPLAGRVTDPALYDGILYKLFYDPSHSAFQPSSPSPTDLKEQHGFRVMDQQGVLVGPEVTPSVFGGLGGTNPFPFDGTLSVPMSTPSLYPLEAQWFNRWSGQFQPYGADGGANFVLDWANPNAVAWVRGGIPSYLQRLYDLNIQPAFVAFSENNLESFLDLPSSEPDSSSNNMRLAYFYSPTFSEYAYSSFHDFLRAVGAPSGYVALPVLPADYQAAQAAGNPQLYRIQPVDGSDPLWWYWSIWRRATFMKGLGQLAQDLKYLHQLQGYYRAPLTTILYQYVGWTAINGWRYDPITNQDLPTGYFLDPTNTLFIDPGTDFLISSQQTPGAFDYYVNEVKNVDDPTGVREAQRTVAFKSLPGQPVTPKIGLHAELEAPYPPSGPPVNYMNTNMGQVFANGFKAPVFDMVWAWEAQCEYIMSMKWPDAQGWETLDVEQTPTGLQVNQAGGYQPLETAYSALTGPYCLFRHQHYNLGQVCSGGSCTDWVSQWVLMDNYHRLLGWKQSYLNAQ